MDKATFGIVLDDAFVEAGSHLKGTIFADVQQEITGAELTIQFSGLVSTKVRYSKKVGMASAKHRNIKHSHTSYAYGSRNIVSCLLPVDSSGFLRDGFVAPGHYKIPFDLELPLSLPSSMEEMFNQEYCRIRYQIVASLKGSGIDGSYNCERQVLVKARPLDTAPLPFQKAPYMEQVSVCCGFGRGSIVFGAMVDDTRLGRGETLTVNMSLRNRTTMAQVKSIEAILTQSKFWSAGSHRTKTSKELVKVLFDDLDTTNHDNQPKSIASQQDLDDIFHEMKAGTNARKLKIPKSASNSYKGSLIAISHKLEIIVNTGTWANSPTITIPILIGEGVHSTPVPDQELPPSQDSSIPSRFSADTTTVANIIRVPSSKAVVGGPAVESEKEGEIVNVPVADKELTPSLDNLVNAMKESLDRAVLIGEKGRDPSWRTVFGSLEPNSFRKILKGVDSEFDETRVAEAVAKDIGSKFTCAYVVAALEVVSDWNRTNIVERLLPYCTDIRANQGIVKSALSEWELIVTQVAFDKAIK